MTRLLGAPCFKSGPVKRGIELSRLTIIRVIALPLAIVAADVATDGYMLYFMKSHMDTAFEATNITSYTINRTDDNVTEQHNANITERENHPKTTLDGLFLGSCTIFAFSLLNLLFGNPSKTLVRNARTSALMASRELESKDVPLPIGDFVVDIFRCASISTIYIVH